jgi:hypothetical protein
MAFLLGDLVTGSDTGVEIGERGALGGRALGVGLATDEPHRE